MTSVPKCCEVYVKEGEAQPESKPSHCEEPQPKATPIKIAAAVGELPTQESKPLLELPTPARNGGGRRRSNGDANSDLPPTPTPTRSGGRNRRGEAEGVRKVLDLPTPTRGGLVLDLPTPTRSGGRRAGGYDRFDRYGDDAPTPSSVRSGAAGRYRLDKDRKPSALEEFMMARGVDAAWDKLEEMQSKGETTDKYTVSRMLMKTLDDRQSSWNNSRVYRGIDLVEKFIQLQPSDVDEVLFNALLDTCCRLKDLQRLEVIQNRMKALDIVPSTVTLGILVKTYGQAGDLKKVLEVWEQMEKQRDLANVVTYGCMIDACVRCGSLEKAVEIFRGMKEDGKHKNTIVYTTLIKGHNHARDLKSALALFEEMREEGVPYNTITFNSIIDACVRYGDLEKAEEILLRMSAVDSNCSPDLITYSTLLKGFCAIGDVDKALGVVQTIKSRGLRPDELVYNTVIDGCVKANDLASGIGLFEEMVRSGMRPSAITHSILVRLYERGGYEDLANEAVSQLYQHHGIDKPSAGTERGRGNQRKERWNQNSAQGARGTPNKRGGAGAIGGYGAGDDVWGGQQSPGNFAEQPYMRNPFGMSPGPMQGQQDSMGMGSLFANGFGFGSPTGNPSFSGFCTSPAMASSPPHGFVDPSATPNQNFPMVPLMPGTPGSNTPSGQPCAQPFPFQNAGPIYTPTNSMAPQMPPPPPSPMPGMPCTMGPMGSICTPAMQPPVSPMPGMPCSSAMPMGPMGTRPHGHELN